MIFPKFSVQSWTKMSEISANTVKTNNEVEQINLLTTCATTLHRYLRVTQLFLLSPIWNLENSTPCPIITFRRVHENVHRIPEKKLMDFVCFCPRLSIHWIMTFSRVYLCLSLPCRFCCFSHILWFI